jgi:hypothetical protein
LRNKQCAGAKKLRPTNSYQQRYSILDPAGAPVICTRHSPTSRFRPNRWSNDPDAPSPVIASGDTILLPDYFHNSALAIRA